MVKSKSVMPVHLLISFVLVKKFSFLKDMAAWIIFQNQGKVLVHSAQGMKNRSVCSDGNGRIAFFYVPKCASGNSGSFAHKFYRQLASETSQSNSFSHCDELLSGLYRQLHFFAFHMFYIINKNLKMSII